MSKKKHQLSTNEFSTYPFKDERDLDLLVEKVGDSKIVMLGESSHGTHEYYLWRAKITRRLIEEKEFDFIAVEGDWPPCFKVNRYVKNDENLNDDHLEILKAFQRWPSWMWANWEVAGFVKWLKGYNNGKEFSKRKGFYGLDVYSLWESMAEIVKYLEKEDPDAAEIAKKSITCFSPYKNDEQQYAWATRMVPTSCESEVIELLNAVLSRSSAFDSDYESPFSAEQNAYVTVNAEKYYRAMVQGGPQSWNIRDNHMMETLDRLLNFHGDDAKAIVWEHNTHIGDARYTDMRKEKMVNIGQLARESYGEENVSLVGFGSYEGSVIAADMWGATPEIKEVPPAKVKSLEYLLTKINEDQFYFLSDDLKQSELSDDEIDHRAIGVVYHPERERYGNYIPSRISKRYDAYVHFNDTNALHPIDISQKSNKIPDLYPWNL